LARSFFFHKTSGLLKLSLANLKASFLLWLVRFFITGFYLKKVLRASFVIKNNSLLPSANKKLPVLGIKSCLIVNKIMALQKTGVKNPFLHTWKGFDDVYIF